MDFRFTNDYPVSKLEEIVSYLLGPRLWIPQTDYPDFLDWAGKTYAELKKENKRAIIALSGKEIVGAAIYQRHKKYSEALEIKNITVRPDVRGRYVANFLMRNTEVEGAQEFNSNYAICDAKAKNFSVRYFLLKNRYLPMANEDLYGLGAGKDIVYRKKLAGVNSFRAELPSRKNLLY